MSHLFRCVVASIHGRARSTIHDHGTPGHVSFAATLSEEEECTLTLASDGSTLPVWPIFSSRSKQGTFQRVPPSLYLRVWKIRIFSSRFVIMEVDETTGSRYRGMKPCDFKR